MHDCCVREKRGTSPHPFSLFFFFSFFFNLSTSFVSVCLWLSLLFLSLLCFFLYKLTPFVPFVPHFLISKTHPFHTATPSTIQTLLSPPDLPNQNHPSSKGDLFRKVQEGKTRGPHLFLSLSHTHYPSSSCCVVLFVLFFLVTFTNKCRHGILGCCCKVSVFWFRCPSPNHLYYYYSWLLLLT